MCSVERILLERHSESFVLSLFTLSLSLSLSLSLVWGCFHRRASAPLVAAPLASALPRPALCLQRPPCARRVTALKDRGKTQPSFLLSSHNARLSSRLVSLSWRLLAPPASPSPHSEAGETLCPPAPLCGAQERQERAERARDSTAIVVLSVRTFRLDSLPLPHLSLCFSLFSLVHSLSSPCALGAVLLCAAARPTMMRKTGAESGKDEVRHGLPLSPLSLYTLPCKRRCAFRPHTHTPHTHTHMLFCAAAWSRHKDHARDGAACCPPPPALARTTSVRRSSPSSHPPPPARFSPVAPRATGAPCARTA